MELFKAQGVYHGKVRKNFEEIEREPMQKNQIIFGRPGNGCGWHPWDNLEPCSCGSDMTPWIFGLENREIGSYYIKCLKCGKSTGKGSLDKVMAEWNSLSLSWRHTNVY